MAYFYDWLAIYQDFDQQVPLIHEGIHISCALTGEYKGLRQEPIKHEGSFCTSIQVIITGNRIRVTGNPSRYNRIDNLFGFTKLDDCVAVYNHILRSMGLSDFQFTKGTKFIYLSGDDGKKALKNSDGARITELHITSNRSTGQGNEDHYIKGISTQRYRNSIPRLHTNGKTCDWLSKKGNGTLIYPSVYNKAHEIELHHLNKIAKKCGKDSADYKYLCGVVHYCKSQGVVRFEQKLKSAFLRRNNLNFYGLFDENDLYPIHYEFTHLDEKLQVEAMTIESISERLIRLDIVNNTRAANATSIYAIQWMAGQSFDLNKSQVKIHRSRLRKIGIDIAETCDISRHSPVYVVRAKMIDVTPLSQPDWYVPATTSPRLSLVA